VIAGSVCSWLLEHIARTPRTERNSTSLQDKIGSRWPWSYVYAIYTITTICRLLLPWPARSSHLSLAIRANIEDKTEHPVLRPSPPPKRNFETDSIQDLPRFPKNMVVRQRHQVEQPVQTECRLKSFQRRVATASIDTIAGIHREMDVLWPEPVGVDNFTRT
jgi:hypothetical protein